MAAPRALETPIWSANPAAQLNPMIFRSQKPEAQQTGLKWNAAERQTRAIILIVSADEW
jgi:hypothetical protein